MDSQRLAPPPLTVPQVPVKFWQFCPQCKVTAGHDYTCPRCRRSLIMSPAEEYAHAMAQMQPQQKGGGLIGGLAQLIAAFMLFLIGVFLLIVAPILGLLYFGLLVLIALIRVLLR